MEPIWLELHPEYGPIYRDGEYVQCGLPVGLSADKKSVVRAPRSGWIRIPDGREHAVVRVEIWSARPIVSSASRIAVVSL